MLQFDVVPVAGEWADQSRGAFPIPDEDVNVELRARDPSRKWKVTFSGSDGAMGIVSEDIGEKE